MIQMNLLLKQKETHRLRKWTYGWGGEWTVKGVGGGPIHTAVFKMDNWQVSTWNSTQCYV